MKIQADQYFAIIPEWILYGDLSSNAVRVFGVLNRFANSDTGKCHPSRKSIAHKARIGLSSVDRAIDELVAFGAVTVKHRTASNGDPTSNEYTLYMMGGLSNLNRPTPNLNRGTPKFEQTGLSKSDNQTIAIMNESQEPYSSSSVDDGFTEFWALYPRKVGKGAARKAWKGALKKTDATSIIDAVTLYRITCPKDPQYVAHPASWLNAERWADETISPNPEPAPVTIPHWEPCDKCAGGWLYQTDDKGYEWAIPCQCRP